MTEAAMSERKTAQNVGTAERVLRIGLGGALAAWALWLLAGGGATRELLLYGALFALGADFLVTGVRGRCPLYRWLGWSTARRKARS